MRPELLLLLLLVLMLAACATPLPARLEAGRGLDRYAFDARFAVRQGEQSHSGRLGWQHERNVDLVLLQDPFGRGLAEIEQRPGRATARLADGRVLEAADAADLVHGLTGVRLPLAGVGRWLPARMPATTGAKRDALGRLVNVERDGWSIEYAYGEAIPEALPVRIFARHGDIELRLSIDNWETAP